MKFCQLIEYSMRNIFLEKLYTKFVEKLVPDPLQLSMSLDQYPKALYFVFIVFQVEGYQNILKLSCRALAFTSY